VPRIRGQRRPGSRQRRQRPAVPQPASDRDKLARLARQPGDAPDDKASQLLREARKLVGPKINGQIDQSCGQTVLLVDALAPKRNCDNLVRVTLTALRVPMP